MSFKITLPNNSSLCLCPFRALHQRATDLGRFFEVLQNYMENKCEGNENKIVLGDFNITIGIMDRDDGKKTKTLLRSFQRSTIYRIYTDTKIANNTKIDIMLSFTDH